MADVVTAKVIYLDTRYADVVAEALGIALLNAVDEEGRACPIPLCDEVSRGDAHAMSAILNMAAIPNFAIVIKSNLTE